MNKATKLLILPLTLLLLGSCGPTASSTVNTSSPSVTSTPVSSEIPASSEIPVSSGSDEEAKYQQNFLKYNIPAGYVEKSGTYYEHEKLAAYIAVYNALPSNYKNQPTKDGEVKIGGVHQNREQRLPTYLTYIEIDVNTYFPKARGQHRIVYSNDFRIFYTANHYGSFTEYLGYQNWTANFS